MPVASNPTTEHVHKGKRPKRGRSSYKNLHRQLPMTSTVRDQAAIPRRVKKRMLRERGMAASAEDRWHAACIARDGATMREIHASTGFSEKGELTPEHAKRLRRMGARTDAKNPRRYNKGREIRRRSKLPNQQPFGRPKQRWHKGRPETTAEDRWHAACRARDAQTMSRIEGEIAAAHDRAGRYKKFRRLSEEVMRKGGEREARRGKASVRRTSRHLREGGPERVQRRMSKVWED